MFDYHPTKPWICYISQNNIFSLWDYSRKVCLKTFHTSFIDLIDQNKNLEIKILKFYDANTLLWLFPNSLALTEKEEETLK